MAHATGYEAITVADTAIGFTAANIAAATTRKNVARAFCTLETGQIRFRYDGTSPSTTVGHLAEIGDSFVIEGISNLKNFRAIRTGSTSGSLRVTYETE